MTTYVDFSEREESGDPSLTQSVGVMVNWAGAGLSLLLIAGMGFWGYNLLKRDVTGVPVIRALEGPMRIAPEDPGGERAEYQDLSVTRVAVGGAEETPAEKVILAPTPITLTEEDLPVAALLPDEPEVNMALAAPGEAAEEPAEPEKTLSPIELAIAEALGQSPSDISKTTTEEAGTSAVADIIPASVAGVARSPRPMARPEQTVKFMTAAASVSGSSLDVVADSIAPGTRLVQLGAYPSAKEAMGAWDSLAGRFGEVMDDKNRVIQEAQAGGKTFFRLRAYGYEDLSDARRFCAVLVAGGENCIPVLHR